MSSSKAYRGQLDTFFDKHIADPQDTPARPDDPDYHAPGCVGGYLSFGVSPSLQIALDIIANNDGGIEADVIRLQDFESKGKACISHFHLQCYRGLSTFAKAACFAYAELNRLKSLLVDSFEGMEALCDDENDEEENAKISDALRSICDESITVAQICGGRWDVSSVLRMGEAAKKSYHFLFCSYGRGPPRGGFADRIISAADLSLRIKEKVMMTTSPAASPIKKKRREEEEEDGSSPIKKRRIVEKKDGGEDSNESSLILLKEVYHEMTFGQNDGSSTIYTADEGPDTSVTPMIGSAIELSLQRVILYCDAALCEWDEGDKEV